MVSSRLVIEFDWEGAMKPLSLRQRLFTVTGLALLPALAAVVTGVVLLEAYRQREVHAEALRNVEVVALEIDQVLVGTENVLRTIAAAPSGVLDDRTECEAFLRRSAQAVPALLTIAMIHPDGRLWCVPDQPDAEINLGDRSYFLEAAAGDRRVTGLYIEDRVSGRKVLPIAWPQRDQEGKLKSVLVGYIDLGWLQDLVEQRSHSPGNSLTLADREGRILARHPMPDRFVGTVIPEDFQRLVHASEPGTEELVSQDGTKRIIGYVPVSGVPAGIYVSLGIAVDPAFAIVQTLATSGAFILTLGSLISFWLAWRTGRLFITRPFARLVDTIEAWRHGQTHVRTNLSDRDAEIGLVGQELDAFWDELLVARAERERLENQRQLMSRELDHRVKNLLATVQVVARQTFAGAVAPETFQKYNGRLNAIASANALLMADRWQSAGLKDVVAASIAPFRDLKYDPFKIEGPEIACGSSASIAFGMALHELCTNAVKYGALSAPDGKVYLTWQVLKDADEFVMEWREEGGPLVKSNRKAGFGSTVVTSVLASQLDGRAELNFRPEGLVFTVRCRVSKVTNVATETLDPCSGTHHAGEHVVA
jgi:two-component sensor histidine kinase